MGAEQRQHIYHETLSRLTMEARLLGDARMLRDDQELTPEITATIIARFRELLQRIGKSETWAAKSMDIKPSTLSQVLSGNYAGDTETRVRKIDKWTEMQMASERRDKPGGFALTSVAKKIVGAAKMICKQDPSDARIAIVHGPARIGKTLTAEYLLSEIPGSAYIRITTAGCGVCALYDMIATAISMPRGRLTAYQTELAVKEVLQDTGRLLIVDEVHKLCVRGKDQGLNVLRDLQDMTKIPMLWLGTADVADYVEGGRESSESVEQIYGRVAWWVDLSYVASRADGGPGCHTIDDIRKVLAAQQLRVVDAGEQFLKELANEPKMGGLAAVVCLCRLIVQRFGDKPITLELLQDVQAERLGRRAAQVVQTKIESRKRRVG